MAKIAREIVLVDLSSIKRNPDNPNYHTADQVRILAQNIKRYGLRNAIELKKVAADDGHQYEVLTGEGRFLAYCHLRDTEATDEWTRIPAIIREDDADAEATTGKRLSENALRWFNWAAECTEFASLKAGGESLENLMNDFGYGKSTVYNLVAVGQCLAHLNLTKEAIFQFTGKLAREDFIKYILPLRISPQLIQSRKGHKGFKEVLDGSYDYSEVKACVQALLSDHLTVADLPQYSEEHRPLEKKTRAAKKTEQQATSQTLEDAEAQSPLEQSTEPERESDESQNERALEVIPDYLAGDPITPALQISPNERAESLKEIGKPKETPNSAAWIVDTVRAVNLKDVSWVLLGKGNPPDRAMQATLGGKQIIVRPDVAERQPVQTKVSRNSRKLSQKAAKPEEEFPDDDEFKECFGQHQDGISECCLLCTDEEECEIASKYAVRCFGKHPEHSDTGLKPSYNCEECSYLTACVRETKAVVDNGKIDFSECYGDLRESGRCSYLCYVPNDSDTPILVEKFEEQKMLLTSRRYAMAIKQLLKEGTVREIFQQDDCGNIMTRTTKKPTRTVWYRNDGFKKREPSGRRAWNDSGNL
jgi:hypothetical protein